MPLFLRTAIALSFLAFSGPVFSQAMIQKGVSKLSVNLNGKSCTIERNQTKDNEVHELYAKTGRGLPQPIKLADGIETLGELEFLDYMKKAGGDDSIIVIDTRTETWHQNLRIPCTTNIPYTLFNDDKDFAVLELLDTFNVAENADGSLDFSTAKTVVAYCNGYWCGQTPAMLVNAKFSLLNLGYPAAKLKYYRGGMQAWTSMGFTVEGDGL